MNINELKLAIIGLGYVGLPLAVEFGKKRCVVGFDINEKRIKELKIGNDVSHELTKDELCKAKYISYTFNTEHLKKANCFIITVPTPIDKKNQPDLSPLIEASKTIGKLLKKNNIVIYESTVYPGATEEVCVPILEKYSKLTFNKDFYCGYSPERINPGDTEHRITSINKVTSGSTPRIAETVDLLYKEIIVAGTYKAENIRIAEAAKVIENTQRDVNIALINELAIIFNRMGIDTQAVLEAAGSKWNFLPFQPGLVGGHCIGVDPYYLTYKAESIGYKPKIILSGRYLNDQMGIYIVSQLINKMIEKSIKVEGANILVLGFAYKENCHDHRNTRVIDIVHELKKHNCNIDVFDSLLDPQKVQLEYGVKLIKNIKQANYDGIILAVAHEEIKQMGALKIKSFGKTNHLFYDIKCLFPKNESDLRL